MNATPTATAPLTATDLPTVLAGPLLRRLEARRLVLWLVGTRALNASLQLAYDDPQHGAVELALPLDDSRCQRLAIGRHAWLHLIDVTLEQPLPADAFIYYDLHIEEEDGGTRAIADWAPHLLYPGQARPDFVRRGRLDHLLHGSCRKPHHPSKDGLLQADALLAATRSQPAERPALLMLSGDQVYADDVAGPMLVAVHRLIERLGLYGEHLDGATVSTSEALYAHPAGYYRREDLLPAYTANEELRERFFGGVKKPVFTSANAHNHLVTFAEVLAMYLLVWSPTPWQLIAPRMPELPEHLATRYRAEEPLIRAFVADLPQAARALAQLPCLMIFDDHDITDDWNLSARWEQSAYGHPFSRRIVGNALLGYLLCQGWGNCPEAFAGELPAIRELLATPDRQQRLSAEAQDAVIDRLLTFDHWHYSLPGQPLLLVLDTRTRRWRSESYLSRPSGLMDWEALCELQHALLDEPAVVIVSPAPMFGVKLIEIVQRLFTWAGYPLLVDAENWMAHRGAAKVMLNIFRHSRTPANYVILSGDVHYSFAYEVHIRHRDSGPRIWQITSSGIKNEFPRRLLDWFDRLNRWLYAPHSPLNWFTKRRRMQITPRIPSRSQRGERLWNGAGLGQVRLDEQGRPCEIRQLNADGSAPTCFEAIVRQEMDG
ncbi:Alkaline phosphatase family protein [Pseudomonas sp. OF001]|uniref:alkaline phosphatase D family protein n=1 Tax=Pseudomonas sp. OF001 TaxID=2772300 RepID=UPI00191A785D|nr:alkaline phosphatase D family protein [Pseudomonas sp. OF001]CAD5379988.1 Alkaline phosphatase family protein [Pseudomonas sp. OF001]